MFTLIEISEACLPRDGASEAQLAGTRLIRTWEVRHLHDCTGKRGPKTREERRRENIRGVEIRKKINKQNRNRFLLIES